MADYVKLSAGDEVDNRPFTHPARAQEDAAVLGEIARRLRLVVSLPLDWPDRSRPLVLRSTEPDGCSSRLVICDQDRLLSAEPLYIVGFFGFRRPSVDAALVDAVDEDLIHEFPAHPDLLGYCTCEIRPGSFVNLVVFATAEATERWRTSAKHAYAARDLSPEFYSSVRLQLGVLVGGLTAGRDPVLLRTKYFDYSGRAIWHAVRENVPLPLTPPPTPSALPPQPA